MPWWWCCSKIKTVSVPGEGLVWESCISPPPLFFLPFFSSTLISPSPSVSFSLFLPPPFFPFLLFSFTFFSPHLLFPGPGFYLFNKSMKILWLDRIRPPAQPKHIVLAPGSQVFPVVELGLGQLIQNYLREESRCVGMAEGENGYHGTIAKWPQQIAPLFYTIICCEMTMWNIRF